MPRPPASAAVWIATVGGIGFAPRAPGTAGAAMGVGVFVLTAPLGLRAHAALVLAVCALGTWAAGASEQAFGAHDDGRIVVDEVAGQLIALTPLLPGISRDLDGVAWLLGLVTAFVAFRVFDIAKPGPVRWAERRFAGGWGVMADDLVAGALAAALVGVGIAAVAAVAGTGGPELV